MNATSQELTYRNPVFAGSCPDPFVLKYLNEYWCYCTGWWNDGRCFGVLHSRDLVHWREIGGALIPFDPAATCYWAPEVRYENGRFLLYYSVGNEEFMQIRVAEATRPAGPFTDCGVRLTDEDFAIDPHVFVDVNGAKYLFYATDFLAHTHIGTGTVCALMQNALQLAGAPRPVTRARFNWQVYDPQRATKGGVRWHTVEGPFVLEHKQRYYQMFSGGNWQNDSYGASYALSDKVLTENEWEQRADGERVMPVLRTIPGTIKGPGHNSAVRGPDNQQMFCVYHFWQPPDRVMAIDRLDWVGERLTVLGPTNAPEPAPTPATLTDYFDSQSQDEPGLNWSVRGGHWQFQQSRAKQLTSDTQAEAQCVLRAPHYSAEISVRFAQDAASGEVGVKMFNEDGAEMAFHLMSEALQITERSASGETAWIRASLPLPSDFVPSAFHLLRVERNGSHIKFMLDENLLRWDGKTTTDLPGFAMYTNNAAAEFAGFAITAGWQDLFDETTSSPSKLGWQNTTKADQAWRISEKELLHEGIQTPPSTLLKTCPAENYELVINARLLSTPQAHQCYGFLPALDEAGIGPLLTVEQVAGTWVLRCTGNGILQDFALAADFDPFVYQQFRILKVGEKLILKHEAQLIGTIHAPSTVTQIGLYANGVIAAFDMVRVSIAKLSMDFPEDASE